MVRSKFFDGSWLGKFYGQVLNRHEKMKSNVNCFIGIDVGYKHLGISFAGLSTSDKHQQLQIYDTLCFDISRISTYLQKHRSKKILQNHFQPRSKPELAECLHFLCFKLLGSWFTNSRVIFMERQPRYIQGQLNTSGMLNIEQLMFSFFPFKTMLISPSSMHKWIQTPATMDYEGRKFYVQQWVLKHPQLTEAALNNLTQPKTHRSIKISGFVVANHVRIHDRTDACALLIYGYERLNQIKAA